MIQKIVVLLAENTVIFSILFAAVWLIKSVFKKHLSARLHYLIWGVVLLKLLIPFSITTAWSPYILVQSMNPILPDAIEQADTWDEAMTDKQPQYTQNESKPVSQTEITIQNAKGTKSAKAFMAEQKPLLFQLKIDWLTVIVCIWLAGAAFWAAWHYRAARQLRRKVFRCRTCDTPEWMQAVFKQCKDELGISRDIRIVIHGVLRVPAIMGVWHPVLMIPDALVKEKNADKMRHVFMHELMHHKRRDLFCIFCINALNALYWFNPLVWLFRRLIHRDMEAACDCMVVKNLGIGHRQNYIKTILEFSGLNESIRLQAAMSLSDGCIELQQRIRSMYMKKTSKSVKATVMTLVLIMLFAAFTSGCQPTPEKPIVQSKDNDSVAQAISQSSEEAAELHPYSAPETWQDEARDESKNIDIKIDANVVVPVDTWGLYELVPVAASKEDTGNMLKAIVGDTPIYGEETLQSKDALIEQITLMKSNESDISEEFKEEFDQKLAELEAKLKIAPDEETVIREPLNLDSLFDLNATAEEAIANGIILNKQGDNTTANLDGTVDMGRQTPAAIYLQYGKKGYGDCVTIDFTDYDDYDQGFFMGEDYTGQELFKCEIDVNDAAEMARKKVEEMGFGYLDIAKTQVCEVLDRNRMENDKFPQCYEFIFTRKLDGAITTYRQGDFMPIEYTPLWDPYEAIVRVDDSGIIGINIETAKSEVIRQAYGIELKDFSDIMDIFKQQVFLENVYAGPGDMDKVVKREIHVTEIRLGYMPTPWKDHEGKIIFTPVWDFFGDEVTTFEEGIGGDLGASLDENNAFHNDLNNQSLLTINALDGTIVD